MKKEILNNIFKLNSFKENQEYIIDNIIINKYSIIVLPTGFGKSLIYQFVGIYLNITTFVICPLISLMEDQVKKLKELKINALYLDSSTSIDNIFNYNFVYLSGETFINLSSNIHINIKYIVFDEAHTIFWKDTFRPKLNLIKDILIKYNFEKVCILSATLSNNNISYLKDFFNINDCFLFKKSPVKDNIEYIIKKGDKLYNLYNILKNNINNKTIVYFLTINKLNEVYDRLKDKFNILIYHGNLSLDYKQEILKKDYLIMFATNAYGMGIDIKDIRNIVIYDLPLCLEDLLQQAGRAGRDGKKSNCFILYNYFDLYINRLFIYKRKNIFISDKEFRNVIDFIYKKDKNKVINKVFN